MKRIRLDLFICMIIAGVIFAGIWFVGYKIGLMEKVFDIIEKKIDVTEDVQDGEVGGYATEDTPRASTMQDLEILVGEGKTFTVETTTVKYSNYGTITGKEYDWHILSLDDDSAFAVKINSKKIQKSKESGKSILPVGKIVLEEPEILEEAKKRLEGSGKVLIYDAYIDMDGEAKATYISGGMKAAMVIVEIIFMIMPITLFALFIITVLWVHSIFVKKGIFPPVFANRNI